LQDLRSLPATLFLSAAKADPTGIPMLAEWVFGPSRRGVP
jgi:hypothetical protein